MTAHPAQTTAAAVSAQLRRAGYAPNNDRKRPGVRVSGNIWRSTHPVMVRADVDDDTHGRELLAGMAQALTAAGYAVDVTLDGLGCYVGRPAPAPVVVEVDGAAGALIVPAVEAAELVDDLQRNGWNARVAPAAAPRPTPAQLQQLVDALDDAATEVEVTAHRRGDRNAARSTPGADWSDYDAAVDAHNDARGAYTAARQALRDALAAL